MHPETHEEIPQGGAPIGPGSLTYRLLGDVRNVLVATRAGLLQGMHPAISAALIEHSDFFANPWNRLLRSAGPILGVVYDAQPGSTGAKVRDYHKTIKGEDAHGKRYHALDPATYYWAHATFFEGQIAAQELFGTPLTREEKEQLYRESITWYGRYGLPMKHMPKDYDAFCEYYEKTIDEVLEATRVAQVSSRAPRRKLPAPYPFMRGPIWGVLRPIVVEGSLFLTRGTLPPKAREKLGLEWSEADEAKLQRFARVVKATYGLLPERARYMPRAYRGMVRARAHGPHGCSSAAHPEPHSSLADHMRST